jgi:uncharacterized protein (TIGR00251 family)
MPGIEGLSHHPLGCCLAVLCQPAAKRNSIGTWHDGHLRIQLLAAPIEGKANESLQNLLAGCFDLKRRDVQLLSGAHNRRKRVLLCGIGMEQAKDRIEQLHRDQASK